MKSTVKKVWELFPFGLMILGSTFVIMTFVGSVDANRNLLRRISYQNEVLISQNEVLLEGTDNISTIKHSAYKASYARSRQ